ncbi:unnamed protein product [Staurois parvus]|uniref:Uncharacterized protein n=1 Tax=Staurois parvus TaxID=386267 RepID=A0ABN9CQ03_9NEOB|nr:unnamed protein product [Staurois parvus]
MLIGSQWRDWQRGVEDTEWKPVEGIGREGWRTLNGSHWRDWRREGWRTLIGSQWRDWQRGVEDTEWKSVKRLAERSGGY